VKTIASRVGEGTNLVLTGDATQIDNRYRDSSSNGLSYLVERLKGKSSVGRLTLEKEPEDEACKPCDRRTLSISWDDCTLIR
jgi:PhoH-like ATPase